MATPQQQIWATGDFAMVGTAIVIVGELLCDSVPVHAGDRVLDIATGSGNTALAAARRGCQTTGIDFVPALLDRARERAAAERLKIEFREGDANFIPYEDESFDVVLSTFGSMFADPTRSAAEMLRVCRSGGKIAMANWTPGGYVGEMFRLTALFAPPPPDTQPPVLWGVPDVVRQRLGNSVTDFRFVERQLAMRHYSPESQLEFMKSYFGPTIRAFQAARERAPELAAAQLDLTRRYNKSGDETLLMYADYIEVIAVKA
jgi:SAM-dependent methyltransferase